MNTIENIEFGGTQSQITITPQKKPTPPAAPAAAPQVVVPTAEEMKQRAIELYTSQGWGDPPPDVYETPAAPPAPPVAPPADPAAPAAPAAAPAAPAAPAAAAAAAPPAPPAEPEPAHEPTTAEIISRAARETAREVAREMRPAIAPAPQAQPEGTALTGSDAADLKVLQYLERTGNGKYMGVADAFLKFVKDNYAYQQSWLKDNPDKEFDPAAEEHAAWYSQHQPDIDTDELDRARVDMQVEERVEAKLRPKIEQEKAENAFRQALPTIAGQVNKAIGKMTQAVDQSLAELLTETPTEETIKKVEEKDPIAFEVMDEIVRNELEPMVLELEKTTVPELNFRLDPQKNPVHAEISKFVRDQEKALLEGPAEVRELGGKQFITLSEYARRANQINQDRNMSPADKDQRMAQLEQDVWCLSVEMIEDLLADAAAKKARTIIDKRNKTAQKKFGTAAAAANPPANPDNPAAAVPIAANPAAAQPRYVPSNSPAGYRPKPPSLSGGGDVVQPRTPGKLPEKNYGETATDVAFSR